MEENNKRYWKGLEELTNDAEFVKNAENEFPEYLPVNESHSSGDGLESNRRDFLKLVGFSVAAASLAACDAPVKKAIPYLNKPEDIDPSIPNYYASTYYSHGDYASILVKTREGRPIKIAGNTLSPINKGGTSSKVQASVLDLYDGSRYRGFFKKGEKVAEKKEEIEKQNAAIDKEIKNKLQGANNIRIVSPTIISPSTKQVIKDFIKKYPSAKHVTYDAISYSGMLEANKESFGKAVLPKYDFSKAKVIVSFAADFLGTWLSPTEFAPQYIGTRLVGNNPVTEKVKKDMSRHYQFESGFSMTGANADYRAAVPASQQGLVIASLYKKLTGSDKFKDAKIDKMLDKAVKDLKAAKGKSLVMCGLNDKAVQVIVNAINDELSNYGNTIDINTPYYLYQGIDKDMNKFISDVKSGSVDAVIFYGTNPVYSHPKGGELKGVLDKVGVKISFADKSDETAELCDYVCPDNHYLESWNDAEPKKGHFSLAQPAITTIFNTRAAQESLLTWTGKTTSFYDYIRGHWKKNLFSSQSQYSSFDEFWNNTLHDGVFSGQITTKVKVEEEEEGEEKEDKPTAMSSDFSGNVDKDLASINKRYKGNGIGLVVYEKVSMGTGAQANNPWLHEMPDPVTRTCWGNYVCISAKLAKDKGLKQDDIVKIEAKGYSFELPVLIQPGQEKNTVSVAVGYGRAISKNLGQKTEGKEREIGANVFPLIENPFISGVTISKTGRRDRIAQVQTHHTIMGRTIIQEATLEEYKKNEGAGRYHPHVSYGGETKDFSKVTLWKGHEYPNHSWGLVVDLNACIGCAACTISCQVENNIPVVGKQEVLNRREMHWIRIDRYYSSDAEDNDLAGLEKASENPEVTFMPMMCQHCNNAPCETVCPVLATTHSTEGLNQMTYNRCVGTRYCANNCPYKVRRFNWFHYAEDQRFPKQNFAQASDLGKMVLNPDVTVRTRGVIEKCSMCIQRIQAGKLQAKKEKRHVKDGDITTACADACPTDGIVFGDMRDENSNIFKLLKMKKTTVKDEKTQKEDTEYSIHEPRAYHVLEEINVKPQVSYLTKIRNKEGGKHKGGSSHEAHS